MCALVETRLILPEKNDLGTIWPRSEFYFSTYCKASDSFLISVGLSGLEFKKKVFKMEFTESPS